jgi:hypothetical protein
MPGHQQPVVRHSVALRMHVVVSEADELDEVSPRVCAVVERLSAPGQHRQESPLVPEVENWLSATMKSENRGDGLRGVRRAA